MALPVLPDPSGEEGEMMADQHAEQNWAEAGARRHFVRCLLESPMNRRVAQGELATEL